MLTQWIIRRIPDYENVKDERVRSAYGKAASLVGIGCNVLLFAGKLFAGLLSGSVAIMADAVNNLSDVSSSLISLLGFKLADRPADAEHPYGHGRFEYLSGMTVAVMILVIGVELLKSSVGKIFAPEPVTFSWVSVGVLAASILVKLWMAAFNANMGRRIGSTTLEATASDSRNDVITTGAVLLCTIAAKLTGLELDGYVGAAVAVFILISGVSLVKETLNPLLGNAPSPELVSHIREKLMSYPGVLGVHDLMIHDYGPGNRLVSFHVEMDANADVMHSHDVIDRIERDLLNQDDLVATIHFDPVIASDSHVAELRSFLQQEVASLDTRANIHDLRIVPGPTHTNVIFDCAVPAEYITEKQRRGAKLAAALRAAVERKWPDHFCIIKLEPDYSAGIHETK